jgi:hypothetical protein
MKNELKRDDTLSIELTKRRERKEGNEKGEISNKLITKQNSNNHHIDKSILIPKLMSFLQNFVIQSKIQAQIISEISSIIDNPNILVKFRPGISALQLRLLFEIILGCGIELVHIREGEEVIVVWNNNNNETNMNNSKIDNNIENNNDNNNDNDNNNQERKKIQNLRLTYIITGTTNKTREIINEEVPHFKSIQKKKFGKENYVSLQYDNLLTWEILK